MTLAGAKGAKSAQTLTGAGVATVAQSTSRAGAATLTGAGTAAITATATGAVVPPVVVTPYRGGARLPHGAARVVGPAYIPPLKRPPLFERHTASLHLTGGGSVTVFGRVGGGYDDELVLEWLLLEAA